jgi:hypothetical protein
VVLYEGITYERVTEKRTPYSERLLGFITRITGTQSKKKMVRKVKDRWEVEIWPRDREGLRRQRYDH